MNSGNRFWPDRGQQQILVTDPADSRFQCRYFGHLPVPLTVARLKMSQPPFLTQSLLLKIGFFWILFRCCSQLFRIFKWMQMSSHNSNPHLHCKWEKSSNAPTSNVDFGNRPERNTSFGAPAALPRPLFLVTGPGRVEWVEIRFLMFFSSWS